MGEMIFDARRISLTIMLSRGVRSARHGYSMETGRRVDLMTLQVLTIILFWILIPQSLDEYHIRTYDHTPRASLHYCTHL